MHLIVKNLQTALLGPLNLELRSGERHFIHGPSGAGKSLLLRALADLDPHQGTLTLNGVSQNEIPASQWRRHLAYLPAESHWWADTVAEHFSHIEEEALQHLGFTHEVVNWQIMHCSSGELQRLALLRLLQNHPEILLLDEPTANLDPKNCQRVEQLLLDYQQQHHAALLWVSHDPQQMKRLATHCHTMQNGQLHEKAADESLWV